MRFIRSGNVIQLTWMPNFFPVNCYLVEEEQSLTLIDAALPFCANGIADAASKLGKRITHIILTHAHDDHVGALDKLKELYPDAKVCISERDSALLRGDRSLRSGEPSLPIRGGVPRKLKTRADILLQEGDTVGSLTAISTPGHTPGSMAFFDQHSRALIAGDAFQTFRGTAVAGTMVPLFPFPAIATWNREAAIASAIKALELNPALLAVGHGNMLDQPHMKIEEAIHRARKRGRG